jgi:hypothetical protein
MQIAGGELARDSEARIACKPHRRGAGKQASYTDHLTKSCLRVSAGFIE